jgi:hypothetical protein
VLIGLTCEVAYAGDADGERSAYGPGSWHEREPLRHQLKKVRRCGSPDSGQ